MADDGLLQEFILLVKLMNLGYQNLQVHIVNSYHTRYLDTTLDERNFFHTVSNEEYKAIAESGELGLIRKNTQNSRRIFLKDIVKNHSEESRAFTETLQQYAAEKATGIRLTFHNNFNKFTEECAEAPTVCIALNYSSCNDSIREFVQLHQVLSPLGLMCVSDSENNHVFSKKQLCTPLSDPRDIQKHLPIHNKSELQIANLGATGFYHFLISVIFPYIQRHPDLKKVHLTLAHPQLAYFDGFEIRGSKHPSDGFTVEDVRYIASLVLSSEIEFTVNYITGYSKFSKLFPCVMSAPDLVVCFKKPNKHNLTGVVDDVKRMATQYPNANHYCGMRGSATETDPSFHVEWVWKHVTQECIILREEGENSPKKEEISEYYTQNKF